MFNPAGVIQGSKRDDIVGATIRVTFIAFLLFMTLISLVCLFFTLVGRDLPQIALWLSFFIIGVIFLFQLITSKKKERKNPSKNNRT